jgi:predicted transposase YbfD/YdcC
MMPASHAKLDDLSIESILELPQLNKVETELNLVAIAAMAISQVDRAGMMQLVRDLELESTKIADWIGESSARKSAHSSHLDTHQLRALVLIVHRLAADFQAQIRQNISNWQQTLKYNQLPLQSPSLADYIGNFITIYQTRIGNEADRSFEDLAETALNLLVDLLFYSSPNGHQRLWVALLQQARSV